MPDSHPHRPIIAIIADDASWRIRVIAALSSAYDAVGIEGGVGAFDAARAAGPHLAVVATTHAPLSLCHALREQPSRRVRVVLVASRHRHRLRATATEACDSYLEVDSVDAVVDAIARTLDGQSVVKRREGWLTRWRTRE